MAPVEIPHGKGEERRGRQKEDEDGQRSNLRGVLSLYSTVGCRKSIKGWSAPAATIMMVWTNMPVGHQKRKRPDKKGCEGRKRGSKGPQMAVVVAAAITQGAKSFYYRPFFVVEH